MPLPSPEYLKLNQLANRWRVSIDDVQLYLETGQLDASVKVERVRATEDYFDKQDQDHFVIHGSTRWLRGFQAVKPDDLYKLFRKQLHEIDELKPPNGVDMFSLEEALPISIGELVILRDDYEQFEQDHEVNVFANLDPSQPPSLDPSQSDNVDLFHTGLPGRPTIGRLILSVRPGTL